MVVGKKCGSVVVVVGFINLVVIMSLLHFRLRYPATCIRFPPPYNMGIILINLSKVVCINIEFL